MHAFATNTSRVKAYGTIAIISVIVAIFVNWIAVLFEFPNNWLISAPTLGATYALLYWFIDNYAWRWPILRVLGLIDVIPVDGKYTGKTISNYKKQKSQVEVVISQTWSRILVQFDVTHIKTSISCSISANYENLGNGDSKLNYTYKNNPNPGIADNDMNPHEGTVELLIKKDGLATGRYFNSRERAGTISLKRKS